MKTRNLFINSILFLALSVMMSACFYNEDPGPLQEMEKEYSLLDFDRLEMGDALNIDVVQGAEFAIKVKGDRRNIDDLVVEKVGSTLRARYTGYRRNRHRQYTTNLTITMPGLTSASFSGAVTASVGGFEEQEFDLSLSGASTATMDIVTTNAIFDISGASKLTAAGSSVDLKTTASGASSFFGYDFEVQNADVHASGASEIRVNATSTLKASASGASDIRYRGNPQVTTSASGASSIGRD